MRKIVGYIVLVICIVLYCASTSETLMKKIADFKNRSTSLLGNDRNRYGGLYGFSYLPEFKILPDTNAQIRLVKYHVPRKIDLYTFCDSYLWYFATNDSLFSGVNKNYHIRSNREYRKKVVVQLDTSKTNVLLIEMLERNVFDLMGDMNFMRTFVTDKKNSGKVPAPEKEQNLLSALFNPKINMNLEFNIWDTRLFTPVREWKAEMNYRVFGRVANEVSLSPDEKQLFLTETIDTSTFKSSFKHVSDKQVNEVVRKLNVLYEHYKLMGFKEVYFTIIPNPVSIISPGQNGLTYHHIIERISANGNRKMPMIDVYPAYKAASVPLYSRSDTHWNFNGLNLWLNKFNEQIVKDVFTDEKVLK